MKKLICVIAVTLCASVLFADDTKELFTFLLVKKS